MNIENLASNDDRFSLILETVRARSEPNGLTIRELVAIFGPRGHSFLSLFLVLPFMQPIPIPGVSTMLGLAIAVLGFRLMQGLPPWLPERIARVHIEKRFLLKIGLRLEILLLRLERFVRPRSRAVFAKRWFRVLNGFILLVHGLVLSLPLPIPFSNFLPAIVLFLIALAYLEEDLAVSLLGGVMMVINAAFFLALAFAPWIVAKHFGL